MLEFPREFFEAQERDGFLVDETMKTVWAAEMEVLNEVAIICDRHNLCWYAAYGTLLGAARHGGFIPWDDDIDIWMLREDYRELMKYLPEELPNGYVIRSPHAREGYPEYQVYIDNSDKISIEPEHLQKFHGCPFMVGIDIFPLDTIPDDEAAWDMQRALFSTTLMLQQLDYEKEKGIGKTTIAEEREAFHKVENLLDKLKRDYHIVIPKDLLQKEHRKEGLAELWKVAEALGKNGSRLTMYLDFFNYHKVYQKAWFEETVGLDFEEFQVPAPLMYDEVLRSVYGDWHIINKQSRMHDYPCYKGQLQSLRNLLKKNGIRET